MEMIENRDHYDVRSSTYSGGLRDDRIDTPSYEQLINDVTTVSTPASLMHLYGISVTWIIGSDNSPSKLAVYEYFGRHEVGRPHGNSRETLMTAPYVRTPCATFEAVSQKLKKQRPQEVYNDLIDTMEVDEAPRNTRVVHNKKAAERREQRAANGKATCHNFADEIQTVFTMSQSDDFVRYVVLSRSRVPSVILYTDRQLREVKSFCFNRAEGSVLGFDKTYNLGSMYVTPSVYKNVALIRRRTRECPIFMGPVFVHGHSDFDTYAQFFGELSAKTVDCNSQQLTLGSDDELAVKKCFAHYFPRSSIVTCSLHLKENVGRKLDELLGSSSTLRKKLFDSLFGSGGLIDCDDIASFDACVESFRSGLLSSAPSQFIDYFDGRLLSLMRQNVVIGPGFSKWTNNNCESINHSLKQSIEWQPQQLPELIDTIRGLVQGQYNDADRALCGLGDYALRDTHARHRITTEVWRSMSAHQRQRAADSCFKVVTTHVTSTDGTITVPTTPGAGKKPHQVKRSRNERSRTVKKLKLDTK